MTAVFDFKSIRQKLDRQEQKAEWIEKNPKIDSLMYGWIADIYGGTVSFELPDLRHRPSN